MYGILLALAIQTPADTPTWPPVEAPDLVQFPAPNPEWRYLNRRFYVWADAQARLDLRRAPYYQYLMDEADVCLARFEAYLQVRYTWNSYRNSVTMSWHQLEPDYLLNYLQALRDFQDLLGPADFSLGLLGPAIPVWTLTRD